MALGQSTRKQLELLARQARAPAATGRQPEALMCAAPRAGDLSFNPADILTGFCQQRSDNRPVECSVDITTPRKHVEELYNLTESPGSGGARRLKSLDSR
jgi:hypothetical protein